MKQRMGCLTTALDPLVSKRNVWFSGSIGNLVNMSLVFMRLVVRPFVAPRVECVRSHVHRQKMRERGA